MMLALVMAEPLVRVVLTAKWLPADPYFRLLCIAGIFHPSNAYNLNILKVKGRSDLFPRLEILRKNHPCSRYGFGCSIFRFDLGPRSNDSVFYCLLLF